MLRYVGELKQSGQLLSSSSSAVTQLFSLRRLCVPPQHPTKSTTNNIYFFVTHMATINLANCASHAPGSFQPFVAKA